MATAPSENLPEWATTPGPQSTVTEPPSAQKTNGWDYGQALVGAWLNWMGLSIYRHLAWFKDDLSGSGRAKANGYKYEGGPSFTMRAAAFAGWTPINYTLDYWRVERTTTPPYGYNPSAAAPAGFVDACAAYPLPFQINNEIAGTLYTIATMGLYAMRADASDVNNLRLMRVKRADALSAIETVATLAATVGPSMVTATVAVAHDVDPLYDYWLEISMRGDVATDCRMQDAYLLVTKTRVE